MLSIVQKQIVGVLSGILLFSIVIFRIQLFDKSILTVYLFMGLVLIAVITFFYFLAKIIRITPWIIFGLVIIIEGLISWKYEQVVKNQSPNVYKLNFWREYYNQHRNIIQFDPDFSVYDNQLNYKLKQGKFTHTVSESKNQYEVNSLGLRDDEKSLKNPEIIAVGDSYTMGWGVDQKQTFSEVIEEKLNKRVLNAGISSYGTARQQMLFKQLDRDSCKILFIQYCENDLLENEKLLALKKDSFDEKDANEYVSLVNLNRIYNTYFPFKNIVFLLRYSIQNFDLGSVFSKNSEVQNYFLKDEFTKNHTQGLFEIIGKIRKYYQGNIIVLHTPAYEPTDKLTKAFEAEKIKSKSENIYIINTAEFLEKTDYYLLDGHIKANAHQKVANSIIEIIRKNKLL